MSENHFEYRIANTRTQNVIRQHKKEKVKNSNVTKAEKKALKKRQ